METKIQQTNHEAQTHSRIYEELDLNAQITVSIYPGRTKEQILNTFAQISRRFYLELAEELNNKPNHFRFKAENHKTKIGGK